MAESVRWRRKHFMKRILVFSDSHGYLDHMRAVLKQEKPDLVIHLGDCLRDVYQIRTEFPEIPIEYVKGNCDISNTESVEKILFIENKKVMICHGHAYNVKSGYLNIEYGAKEKQADAVLFGHTHRAFYNNHNGLVMLNPGSIGFSVLNPASYGWLTIDGELIKADVAFIEEKKN